MKRATIAAALLLSLGGCGIFGGGGNKGPKTPLVGNRIPILALESGAEADANLADVSVIVPTAVANETWSQPGGGASKSMGHLALGTALERAWSVKFPGNSKKVRLGGGPVVAGGTVYVIDTDATVRAYALSSGASRWSRRLVTGGKDESAAFGGGVSVEDGKVYATTGLGDVVALDATTGNQLWKVRPAGPLRGAPAVFGGQLYVVSQDNQIFALNVENGSTVWNEAGAVENSGIFGVAAPAAAQGTVVAGFSSGELTAYRYENGRAVWQDTLSRTSMSTTVASLSDIDASPVIDEGRVYAIGQGGRMVALELVTGQRLWELNIGGISTPWVAGEWVFAVSDQARLFCISRSSGKIRWVTQLKQWRKPKKKDKPISWTGPVVAGDRLILANTEGQLVNVRLADGTIGTSTKLGDPIYAQPVVVGNTLLVMESNGRLTAWR